MTGQSTLLLMAGLVLGAGATLVARELIGPGPQSGASAAAAEIAGISRQVAGLEAVVRELRESMDRSRSLPTANAGSEIEPLPGSSTEQVMAQLDALRATLQSLSDRIDAQSAESRAVLSGIQAAAVDRASEGEPMPEMLTDKPLDLQHFDLLRGRSEDEMSDDHLLWSYDKVAETYGRPSGIRPSPSGGGIKFYYDLPGGETLIFWFKSGKVVRVLRA